MEQAGEVGGREDRGSYWASLILSFVSLWIAFVYTVSSRSGIPLTRKHASTHGVVEIGASFLCSEYDLAGLSNLIWKEGWNDLTCFKFFHYRKRDLKMTAGERINDFSNGKRRWCWESLTPMCNFFMLVASLETHVWHLEWNLFFFWLLLGNCTEEKETPFDFKVQVWVILVVPLNFPGPLFPHLLKQCENSKILWERFHPNTVTSHGVVWCWYNVTGFP